MRSGDLDLYVSYSLDLDIHIYLCLLGLHLQPLLFMTALYREENLKKLITASPLTKTLEEIKEALKKQAQGVEYVTASLRPNEQNMCIVYSI